LIIDIAWLDRTEASVNFAKVPVRPTDQPVVCDTLMDNESTSLLKKRPTSGGLSRSSAAQAVPMADNAAIRGRLTASPSQAVTFRRLSS